MKNPSLEKDIPKKNTSFQRKQAKVLILDDHPIVRQGIGKLINQELDLTVCGEAEDIKIALEMLESAKPDIALVDISLNGSSGIEFLRILKERYPHIPSLVLSMHDEMLYAERVIREGAKGYIMKQEATDKILTAIRKILNGQMYLSEKMMGRILEKQYGGVSVGVSPVEVLSDRELEVFRLIGEGKTTSAIAKQFHRSIKTIETYRSRIKDKLCLKHNMELIRYAMHWLHSEGGGVPATLTATAPVATATS